MEWRYGDARDDGCGGSGDIIVMSLVVVVVVLVIMSCLILSLPSS